MTGTLNFGARRHHAFLPCLLLALLVIVAVVRFPPAGAQGSTPILISEETSTRALVFDSTTREREPFTANTQVTFGGDTRRRLMIFAMHLQLEPGELPSAVVARAEDASHQIYLLPVEHVGPTPGQTWATSIVVSLDPAMGDLGDVLVGVTYHGVSSNRVRVG
ncbi:MAG TPA: hypothetical protein VFV61_00200, partial [Pyrinomonadaceae bacterium]|nr:hypothetical protein [Pyrinomonadaceae bacterium]